MKTNKQIKYFKTIVIHKKGDIQKMHCMLWCVYKKKCNIGNVSMQKIIFSSITFVVFHT